MGFIADFMIAMNKIAWFIGFEFYDLYIGCPGLLGMRPAIVVETDKPPKLVTSALKGWSHAGSFEAWHHEELWSLSSGRWDLRTGMRHCRRPGPQLDYKAP